MLLTIKAIRTNMGLSRKEMADLMGVTYDRWVNIELGRSQLKAKELIKLHDVSGIPYENISI